MTCLPISIFITGDRAKAFDWISVTTVGIDLSIDAMTNFLMQLESTVIYEVYTKDSTRRIDWYISLDPSNTQTIAHIDFVSRMVPIPTLRRTYMKLVMRKPAFCICENKDADQLGGNREADQRLWFRYTDSTIPLIPTSEISSL